MTTKQIAKHTPGPWGIRNLSSGEVPNGDIEICGSGARICIIEGSDAYHYGWNSEREANARLIAAAPDLLGTLNRITGEAWAHNGGEAIEQLKDIKKWAKSSIAKAGLARRNGC